MEKTKELKRRQTGITLIALVITIIVLLILAGVSIATLTGNNGILTQANQAKENNNSAAVKEKVEVEALGSIDKSGKFNKETFKDNLKTNLKLSDNDIVDNADGTITVKIDGYDVTVNGTTGEVTGVTKSNGEKPTTGVQPGTEVSKTEKDNYTDSNKEKATIPEGFTVDETENTISSGLVVHGPDGSEFVWVPVSDINSMSQCSAAGGDCNLQLEGDVLKCKTHNNNGEIVGKLYATDIGENFGTVNKIYMDDSGLREPAYLTNTITGDVSNFNTIGVTLSDMQINYKNMSAKVAKYGGFYVGRYEASEANNRSLQSKSGLNPVALSWYELYYKCNKTYTGKNDSVESSMIWGSQYDAMLNWAKTGNDKNKITNTSLGNNSSGSVTTTGNSTYAKDSINNIRDLGGNLYEWTLEANATNCRVLRGGVYSNSCSPSCRNEGLQFNTNDVTGGRFTLYIK